MNFILKHRPLLIGLMVAVILLELFRLEMRISRLEQHSPAGSDNASQAGKRSGSEYVGTWRLLHRVQRQMPMILVISKNGEQFLVTDPGESHQGAVYRDGMLVLSGGIQITYIESTRHLTYFEAEYVRED